MSVAAQDRGMDDSQSEYQLDPRVNDHMTAEHLPSEALEVVGAEAQIPGVTGLDVSIDDRSDQRSARDVYVEGMNKRKRSRSLSASEGPQFKSQRRIDAAHPPASTNELEVSDSDVLEATTAPRPASGHGDVIEPAEDSSLVSIPKHDEQHLLTNCTEPGTEGSTLTTSLSSSFAGVRTDPAVAGASPSTRAHVPLEASEPSKISLGDMKDEAALPPESATGPSSLVEAQQVAATPHVVTEVRAMSNAADEALPPKKGEPFSLSTMYP